MTYDQIVAKIAKTIPLGTEPNVEAKLQESRDLILTLTAGWSEGKRAGLKADVEHAVAGRLLAAAAQEKGETFIPEAYEAGRRAGEKAIIIPKDDHYQGGV